jgi:plasmid stabilization system protein ParE
MRPPSGGRRIAPRQAARWYAGFSAAIDSLAENPDRCPLARENDLFPYELRELHDGLGSRPTHRAVFTIRPDAVVILTIRHAAQKDLTPDDLPGSDLFD